MAHPLNAWKACKRQNRFGGSNPPHSANKRRHSDFFSTGNKSIKASSRGKKNRKTTAKDAKGKSIFIFRAVV